jgi:hypothetical protein
MEKISEMENEIEELKEKNDKLESDLSDLSTDCVRKDGIPEILKNIIQTIEDELGVSMIQDLIKTKTL